MEHKDFKEKMTSLRNSVEAGGHDCVRSELTVEMIDSMTPKQLITVAVIMDILSDRPENRSDAVTLKTCHELCLRLAIGKIKEEVRDTGEDGSVVLDRIFDELGINEPCDDEGDADERCGE